MAEQSNSNRFWLTLARRNSLRAASVSNFVHAALAGRFKEMARENVIVEAATRDAHRVQGYWLARVVRIEGYFVQLRWIGGKFEV